MFNKKKITVAQYCDILKIDKVHFSWMFNFFITKHGEEYYVTIEAKKKFLPLCSTIDFTTQFFHCMWHCGLKNMSLPTQTIDNTWIMIYTPAYERLMYYWDK